MTDLAETGRKSTKGSKLFGLLFWAVVFLLSVYLVYGYSWIITGILLGGFSLAWIIMLYKELRVILQSSNQNSIKSNFDSDLLNDLPEILYFKSGEAAFEYSRKYMKSEGDFRVALISSISRKDESGLNLYDVQLYDDEGKIFMMTAFQHERLSMELAIGDFVTIMPLLYDNVPTRLKLKKMADIVLFIYSRLKPEYSIKESAWHVEI